MRHYDYILQRTVFESKEFEASFGKTDEPADIGRKPSAESFWSACRKNQN